MFAKRIRIVGWTAVATGALLCVVASATGRFNVFEHIFPANVVHNFYTSLVRVNQIEHYQSTSEGWSAHGRRARHNTSGSHELYVLVVGETSRAENWQLLGYSRDTNPKLSTLSGLTVCPEAYTCSNTTHKSVPMMLSSLTPYDFDSINYRKGMLATFGEAGFRTAFISNQSRNRSYIDFFGEQADTTIFLHDDSRPHYDTDLLTHTADLMAKGLSQGDMLLVVHTYGSHFNYRDRYPRSQAHFLPDDFPSANLANRQQLVNAYDNTVRFTDKFLYDLISQVDSLQIPAVVIYASDHGEDLYDDSRHRFLHASPRPTRWQLHVPMLVWTSEDYRKAYPDLVEALQSNSGKRVSPSTSVYHTILVLWGVATDDYDPTLSLTSTSYQPHRPVYLNDRNTPESDIR